MSAAVARLPVPPQTAVADALDRRPADITVCEIYRGRVRRGRPSARHCRRLRRRRFGLRRDNQDEWLSPRLSRYSYGTAPGLAVLVLHPGPGRNGGDRGGDLTTRERLLDLADRLRRLPPPDRRDPERFRVARDDLPGEWWRLAAEAEPER